MPDLTTIEIIKLEKLFKMESGYVLDFSNNSLQRFVAEYMNIDIYKDDYAEYGGSKANRLRSFWRKESNVTTGKLILELCNYWRAKKYQFEEDITPNEEELYNECLNIAERMQLNAIVENTDILKADDENIDTDLLIKQIKDAIESKTPEAALDRIHTFLMKKFRYLCVQHGLSADKSEPLHSLYGKYVKNLVKKEILGSKATVEILKSNISFITTFSDVRNHQSFAHDNPLLNYEESVYILNSITNTLRLIEVIENKHFTALEPDAEDFIF